MPYSAAHFELTIDGHSMAAFTQLAGISSRTGSVDFIEGRDDPETLLNRFVGIRTPTHIKFVRPRTTDARISNWHRAARVSPTGNLKNCALEVHAEQSDGPVATYNFSMAWPSKLEPVGSLTAAGGTPQLMETVTMTCEFIQRVSI